MDFDGKVSYSDPITISVERRGETHTNIYPNPSNGQVNVEIQASEGQRVSADVYDANGRLVIGTLIDTVSDGKELNAKIDQDVLSQGVYYILLNVDGEVTSHKLIIIE